MNNAEKFKQIFDLYATELWAMSEEKFLEWLNAEALEKQEQDRWIPCKERLPEYKEKVLVSYDTEDGKKVDISMFDKYGCLLGIVDAWRPLPEPYTEGKS